MAWQALAAWTGASHASSRGAAPARMSFTDFEQWMQAGASAGAAKVAVSAQAAL